MSSSESDYVPNEHEDVDKIWLICNTIWEKAMLKVFCKFTSPMWIFQNFQWMCNGYVS